MSTARSLLFIGDVICVCKQPLFFGDVLFFGSEHSYCIYTTTHSPFSNVYMEIRGTVHERRLRNCVSRTDIGAAEG
jgi:hypothetical protein